LLAALPGGCIRDYGRGGTGEWVVPREQFREIEGTDLGALSTVPPEPPTTRPSTQPVIPPGAPPSEVMVSIGEVREMALRNNLDLAVQLLNPSISRTVLGEEEAQFESAFTLDANYAVVDQPTASELNATEAKSLSVTPGFNIPLLTGGTIRLAAPFNRFETNNQFSTLNPAYESDVSATLSQPLLRGAGLWVTGQRIRVAFYSYQQTEAATKLEVIRVLADAERIYWRLYAARLELRVRQQQYNLAVALLDRTRRLAAQGQVAEVEIVRSESGVADAVEAIILADNAVRDRQRDLKRILNAPGIGIGSRTILVPATAPAPVHYALDPERMTQVAVQKRMELLDAELQIAQQTANVRFARNDMLPLVSLQYTYNVNGLGPSLDQSLTLTRERDFEDHTVGVRVEVPIGNEAARNRLRRAMLNRLQALATREQRELQVRQEVYAAVDDLEANWQRILAARSRAELAARVVEAENRGLEAGTRTATDVLQAQANLADAFSSQVTATAEYQITQIDLSFATGTLLGASRVVWDPITGPRNLDRDELEPPVRQAE
jgi:outer membrane protein TolC